MKITRVKFYQAVSIFNGQKFELVTHINMGDEKTAERVKLEILDNVGLIVHTEGESTIITFNNIAFMTVLPKQVEAEKPKANKKA